MNREIHVITIYQYYDYLILQKENNKYVEKPVQNSVLKVHALVHEGLSMFEQLEKIKSLIAIDTLSDVVMTTVFLLKIEKSLYVSLKQKFSNLSEEEFLLNIYRDSVGALGIVYVQGTYPFVFERRLNTQNIIH